MGFYRENCLNGWQLLLLPIIFYSFNGENHNRPFWMRRDLAINEITFYEKFTRDGLR